MPAPTPSQSPFSTQRWRTTFFAEPDRALASVFHREITWDNLNRARLLVGLTLVLGVLLVAVPDFLLWRSGGWERNPALRDWFLLHVALLVVALGSTGLLHLRRRAGPSEVSEGDNLILILVSAIFLLVLLLTTLVQQEITGQITTLLLGIGVYSACFYSTPRESLLMVGGFTAALVLSLPLVQTDPAIVTNHVVVASVFALVFWFVSRLIYSLRAHDFNQLTTISNQARHLEAANEELRKANRLKSELVGIAAHDLRDPLNAISGLAQELERELPPAGAAHDLVNGIGESARRISHLVENLLTEAERDTAGLKLQREPTPLVPLIEDVLADYRWLAGSKNLELRTDLPLDSRLLANVDPRRFRQLLENLISNAIKYSPGGKRITVSLRPADTGGARLEVQDEGVGLLPEDQTRLFGKFARLSSRPTNNESTTGLGLAIVKAIVEAHGGRIWAVSPGRHRGTTFIVELP